MNAMHGTDRAAVLTGLRLLSAGNGGAARIETLLCMGERDARRQQAELAMQSLAQQVQATLAGLPQLVDQRLEHVAGLVVELGLAVAAEVVGVAVSQGRYDPTPTVVRCLRDCVHGNRKDDLQVRLHPDDLAVVTAQLQSMPEIQDELRNARFVADATLARGVVRAETETGRLLHDPREILQRVSDALRREVTQ